jgi:hypothetical protein
MYLTQNAALEMNHLFLFGGQSEADCDDHTKHPTTVWQQAEFLRLTAGSALKQTVK